MAMQDMNHSPFRMVDEINQGMDERNERLVFSRIVACTTGERMPQYFLITPKLLEGASHHVITPKLLEGESPHHVITPRVVASCHHTQAPRG